MNLTYKIELSFKMHIINPIVSRRLLKKVSSKAAGSADPEAYWTSTLRGARDRERSGRPFSAACHV
jgi:hypothetical protein